MSSATATISPLRLALYEGAGSQPLDGAQRGALLTELLTKGYQVACTGRDGGEIECEQPNLLVLGRFGGAAPAEKTTEAGVRVRFRDIEGASPAEILSAVAAAETEAGSYKPGTWKPWNPVIDYDRCTNCMQCLSFCLFDVYGVSKAGKLEVQNPANCKTSCPACSRVCPEVAIIFPKYKASPINGAEVNTDDVRREHMKIDISSLLGGDIYAALRDRSEKAKSRFSKERDAERALTERAKCLTKLQQQLDIPQEVLNALPDLATIQANHLAALKKVSTDPTAPTPRPT